jgi:transcriptional regulator with XRE-family HTH domain
MRLRNNIFAAAFDYLKREKGIKTQKRLAELMGVSEDTITRILKDRCEVTEDIITKLQTASGCIFNLQWLRGEDPLHMLVEDLSDGMVASIEQHEESRTIDQSSLMNAALAAKDETIRAKDEIIASLRETIESLKRENEMLHQQLNRHQAEEMIKRHPFPTAVADEQKTRI